MQVRTTPYTVTLHTLYDSLSDDVKSKLNKKKYFSIVSGYTKALRDSILDGELVVLPGSMGHIEINGNKIKVKVEDGQIKRLAPDWKSTKELWNKDEEAKKNKKLVYFFNEHSKGIRYKFYWSKKRVKGVVTISMYVFVPARSLKRDLAKLIKSGKEYRIKEEYKPIN